MNRPSTPTLLLGNGVVFVSLCLGSMWLCYQYVAHGASGFAALLSFAAAAYSGSANKKVQEFNAWKREWEGMAGQARPGLSPAMSRRLAGVVAWLLLAWAAVLNADDPALALPVGAFWLATVAMIAFSIWKFAKGVRPARSAKDVAVRVCIPVSRTPSTVDQAYASLPDYCRRLLS